MINKHLYVFLNSSLQKQFCLKERKDSIYRIRLIYAFHINILGMISEKGTFVWCLVSGKLSKVLMSSEELIVEKSSLSLRSPVRQFFELPRQRWSSLLPVAV